jgi:hypothetical protein
VAGPASLSRSPILISINLVLCYTTRATRSGLGIAQVMKIKMSRKNHDDTKNIPKALSLYELYPLVKYNKNTYTLRPNFKTSINVHDQQK